MARVGGRNAFFAWLVGLGCLAIVGVLAFLALPMVPASLAWLGSATNRTEVTSTPVAAGDDQASGALPTECGQLVDEAMWAELRFAKDSVLTPSKEAPVTTAAALVAAVQPQVSLTCAWHSEKGTVSATLATVPPDAGAIATAALPAAGFTCESREERALCTRTDGDLVETVEAAGGLWLSTSETGWHPAGLADSASAHVWP